MLRAAVDVIVNMHLVQLLGQLGDDGADVLLTLGALLADLLHQVLISGGVNIAQGEILQLLLDGVHAQAMGQRCVDVQRFAGDGHLALRLLELHGAHVVEAVRQLDEHHADVLGHGHDHLAQGFSLGLFLVGEIQLIKLGHAVHQPGYLVAKLLAQGIQGDIFAILHRIVEQARRDGRRVDHQFRQDARHEAGMHKIRLAALAFLILVSVLREQIRLADQLCTFAGVILFHAGKHGIEGHRFINRVHRTSSFPWNINAPDAQRKSNHSQISDELAVRHGALDRRQQLHRIRIEAHFHQLDLVEGHQPRHSLLRR